MKVKCIKSVGDFEKGQVYGVHVHVDCLHYVEKDGHHFRLLDYGSGDWFFEHFEFVEETK